MNASSSAAFRGAGTRLSVDREVQDDEVGKPSSRYFVDLRAAWAPGPARPR